MNKIVKEIKNTGVFFIATMDGDQPRVRPFSSICEFEGNIYFCSNNTKKVCKQISANNKIEISAMCKDGDWIRLTGKLIRDERDEAKAAMLADPTGPSNLYKPGDKTFEVFRLENAQCIKYSMFGAPIEIKA